MRYGWIAAAVFAVAAQEPPKAEPPRHVNKITPAAQAVFDKMASLAYSPVKLGLKDLTGAVKMEMEATGDGARGMGAMGKMELVFAVAFKAPSDLKVELKDAPAASGAETDRTGGMAARMMKGMGEGMSLAVQRILKGSLEGYVPATDSEFDADVKVENGVTTVLITTYLKGEEVSREAITLDANGIPSVMVSTPKNPRPGDGKSTVKFTYAKEGDLFRLERMTMDAGPSGSMEAKLEYADAGKFKVVKSWRMAPANGPFQFGFQFSEMVVNGKAVDLSGAKPVEKPPAKGE